MLVQSKFRNHFTLEEAVGRATIAIVAHPFDYAKSLIQLGYEPLPASQVTTIFRTQKWAYPNVFRYLSYIKEKDGSMGLFRGLRYKILFTMVNGYVAVNLSEMLKQVNQGVQIDPSEDDDTGETVEISQRTRPSTVKDLIDQLMRETFCKFLTLGATYPLQLLVLRSFAQFVGHETVYDSLSGAITDIYTQGGVGGFYAGFVPKFFGDVMILWTSHGLIFISRKFIDGENSVQSYLAATINFVVASFMYPFSVVSTVMAVNGAEASSLMAADLNPNFQCDWSECWRHLSSMGQLKRGSSLFWRYQASLYPAKGIVVLNKEL
ncbi:Mitochondrial carrier -like protein 2 [Halotydeus destructor]|nr:Mitochondrial carrier -like protein 2 [Halotydeus destructor]